MPEEKKNFFYKEPYFLIALAAVTVVTMVPFIFTGFATGDDIEFFLKYHSIDMWKEGFQYAQNNGRFYYSFMKPLFYEGLPYMTGSYVVPKVLNILLITLNYVFFCFIVKELFNNKWVGLLCYLIGIVFISVKGVNNPIVSYPTYFSLSFSLILLAIWAAIKYKQTQQIKYSVWSAISFFLGLLFYENYLIYLPLIIGLIVYDKLFLSSDKVSIRIKESFKSIAVFVVLIGSYLTVYILWRTLFSESNYKGANVSSENSLFDIFNTITSMTRGAYPLFFYFSGHTVFSDHSYLFQNHIHGLHNVLLNAKVEWIFKATIVGLLFYYISKKVNITQNRKLIYIALVSIVFVYAPQFILAFTVKYSTLVKCCGLDNYLTTYFSVFPIALLLCLILMVPLFYIKRTLALNCYLGFVSVLVALASIVNDYANYHAVVDLKNSYDTFEAVGEFIKTEEYKNIPDGSAIYAPQLYIENSEISYMFAQHFDWSNYFYVRSKKRIGVYGMSSVFKEPKAMGLKNYYYMNYGDSKKTEDQFFAIAPIPQNPSLYKDGQAIVADSVTVYYYSTNKSFSVFLGTTGVPSDSNSVNVNGKDYPLKNNYIELLVEYRDLTNFFKPIKIKAKNIDINSIVVTPNYTSVSANKIVLE